MDMKAIWEKVKGFVAVVFIGLTIILTIVFAVVFIVMKKQSLNDILNLLKDKKDMIRRAKKQMMGKLSESEKRDAKLKKEINKIKKERENLEETKPISEDEIMSELLKKNKELNQ